MEGPHRQPRATLRPQQPADHRGRSSSRGSASRTTSPRPAPCCAPRTTASSITPEYENILFSSSAAGRRRWCRRTSRTRGSSAERRAARPVGDAERLHASACSRPSAPSSGSTSTSGGGAAPVRRRPGPVLQHRRRLPDRLHGGPLQRLGRPARPRPDARLPRLRLARPHPRRSTSRRPRAGSSSTRRPSTRSPAVRS